MWQYNYTDELYHAGVKGMKWGHRKARDEGEQSSGRKRGSTSKKMIVNQKLNNLDKKSNVKIRFNAVKTLLWALWQPLVL